MQFNYNINHIRLYVTVCAVIRAGLTKTQSSYIYYLIMHYLVIYYLLVLVTILDVFKKYSTELCHGLTITMTHINRYNVLNILESYSFLAWRGSCIIICIPTLGALYNYIKNVIHDTIIIIYNACNI